MNPERGWSLRERERELERERKRERERAAWTADGQMEDGLLLTTMGIVANSALLRMEGGFSVDNT
jgi:hypothetical protein